jgi:hypothetical protein
VDDWPDYITRWLQWRPRGLVIMPDRPNNKGFDHPQVHRFSEESIHKAYELMDMAYKRE